MRRPLAALVLSLAAATAPATVHGAATRPPRLPLTLSAAARGETVAVEGIAGRAEVLSLAEGLAAGLLATELEEQVRVTGWPVAPGVRADVLLTRRDVYAPDAVIWEVGPSGRREVPRSPLVFLWGEGESDLYVRVMAAVDPRSGELTGVATTPSGVFELRPAPRALVRGSRRHLLAPHDVLADAAGVRTVATEWACGQPDLHDHVSFLGAPSAGGPRPRVAAAITTLHTATVAVDTDNELMLQKFGDNVVSANDYLASLFAVINVIYERDLLVRLVQGTTFLRLSAVADPYGQTGSPANGAQLDEVEAEWQNVTYSGISRALVMMLSGKSTSPNSASGIASLNALCDTTRGYSYTQVFKFAGSTASHDGFVVPHELGHNFGAPHTHCHNPPLDICFSGEGGCYAGATSCPAPPTTINGVTNVTGTLMSYCHTLGGCVSPQTNRVFHPGSAAVIQPLVEQRVGQCVFPVFQITSVSPNNGLVAGGETVTITGAGFDAANPDFDVTVTFGTDLATVVDIPNSTTIQVTAPPHATGTVSVTVTNPGGTPSATRPNAYFYAPAPVPSDFHTLTPCRVLDTRDVGGAIGAGQSRIVQVGGVCGVPAGASVRAVSANLTVVQPAAGGFLSAFPENAFFLGTSSLNFGANQTRANNGVLVLATNGNGQIEVVNGAPGAVHLLVDVNGYFE